MSADNLPKRGQAPADEPGVFDRVLARTVAFVDRAGRRRPQAGLPAYLAAVWRRHLAWQARRTARLLHDAVAGTAAQGVPVRCDAETADRRARRRRLPPHP